MFYNRSNLATIYAPTGCDMNDARAGSGCLRQSGKLVGNAGTAYSNASMTAAMGRIDGVGGRVEYFTAKQDEEAQGSKYDDGLALGTGRGYSDQHGCCLCHSIARRYGHVVWRFCDQ